MRTSDPWVSATSCSTPRSFLVRLGYLYVASIRSALWARTLEGESLRGDGAFVGAAAVMVAVMVLSSLGWGGRRFSERRLVGDGPHGEFVGGLEGAVPCGRGLDSEHGEFLWQAVQVREDPPQIGVRRPVRERGGHRVAGRHLVVARHPRGVR